MSYCQLMKIEKDGTVTPGEEFRNSHRFCALVWRHLCHKYSILDEYGYPDTKKVWTKENMARMEQYERIVLQFTFDNVMVRRFEMGQLIEALMEFVQKVEDSGHCQGFVEALMKYNREDILGVGLYGVSIIQNPFGDHYDEGTDTSTPRNVLEEDQFWWMDFYDPNAVKATQNEVVEDVDRLRQGIEARDKVIKALRAECAEAYDLIEEWKEASGLESGGDPDGVTPAKTQVYWSKVGHHRDELGSMLSECFANRFLAESICGDLWDRTKALLDQDHFVGASKKVEILDDKGKPW